MAPGSATVSAVREAPASDRSATPQLGLFGASEHPLLDELRALDPDAMTPLGALQRLAEWKRRWG
jgi:hypothetical protein